MALKSSLPRRSPCCALLGEPLESGSSYVSHLQMEDEEWIREDYCINCWNTIEKEKKGTFWKGKIPPKKPVKISHDAKALLLLREWSMKNDEGRKKLLWILALYLERRGQLTKRPEMRDRRKSKSLFYEAVESGEIFSLEMQSLSLEDSELLIQDLLSQLNCEEIE